MDTITIHYRKNRFIPCERTFLTAEFDSALEWTLAGVRSGDITFDGVAGDPTECEVFEATYAMHRAAA